MEMGAVDKHWAAWISPAFGIEVKAKYEVGLNDLVYDIGASTDLGGTVEKSLG